MAGGIDLNNPLDFAKTTNSSLASIVQQINGRDPSKWDIEEASFNGVKFHIFSTSSIEDTGFSGAVPTISDKGGNRLAPFKFPYVDGATFDNLGLDGETFDFDIVLFGNNYRTALSRLFKELRSPQPGKLVHPVRGIINCRMQTYEILHSNEKRKAVALKIVFVEQSFTIGDFKISDTKNVKSALSGAVKAFALIDNVITRVSGTVIFANTLIATIVSGLQQFKLGYAKNLRSINQTFNNGTSVDIPLLLPTNLGGVQGPDGSITSNVFSITQSPSDSLANIPVDQALPTVVATKQAIDSTNALRIQINALIDAIASGAQGAGSLEFHAEILDLKNITILMQQALEAGIASSNARVSSYVVPRLMSIREVAFLNGLPLERSIEIELLNPALLSVNFIDKGSVLQVPAT